MPPGARYVQRNLYLRSRLAYQLRNVAINESWELADLARTMVMVGLTNFTKPKKRSVVNINSSSALMHSRG